MITNTFSLKNGKANRIQQASVVKAFVLLLKFQEIRKPGLRLLKIIWKDFFSPQFLSRFRLRKRKIVSVDHPLDNKIPFSPSHVKDYMYFTHLWVKSLVFLYLEFSAAAISDIASFLNDLSSLYINAFQVHNVYQSTTKRPRFSGGPYFYLIRLADPHLHCLPSLHVMITGFTFFRITDILKKLAKSSNEYEQEKVYLFSMTIKIIDSILFIKQHSVNCIPSGFLLLHSTINDFPEDLSRQIINNLLQTSEIPVETGELVRSYMNRLYNSFSEKSKNFDAKSLLIDFLKNYDIKKYKY